MTERSGALAAAFAAAAAEDRSALICSLPAGYPDLATAEACLVAAADAGADVLEVGFPFSDPVMDGPVIQAASQEALARGLRVDDDLALCRRLTQRVSVPALVMTYVSIPAARGFDRFARDAAAAGLVGVILPDLPADEAGAWLAAARPAGLDTVFLAAPVSSDERLDALTAASSGFVYATALMGVTGSAASAAGARRLVERIRERTSLPVAVGIGVATPDQAREVAAYADGVIVGTALVRAVADGPPSEAPARVARLVAQLRAGMARAHSDAATPR